MGAGLQPYGNVLALADEVTGLPITELRLHGPLERLTATDVAQPAVVAVSLAALDALRSYVPELSYAAVAGHSVGEYAAYVAAGVFDPRSALELVHVRAQAMLAACQAVDGTMAAVLGLDLEPLRMICAEASRDGSSIEVANVNAPGQLIVSGARDALDRLSDRARAAGARRVVPLNVGGPFHSVYMRLAADPVARAVAAAELRSPRLPIVVNASAQPVETVDALRDELAMQVYSPVRWIETLQRLQALGCDRFLEVGPGQVLAGLVKRTLPEARVASFGSLGDLDAARALL
jgi:[acyl-carrier-protein] S-malonyltransferase